MDDMELERHLVGGDVLATVTLEVDGPGLVGGVRRNDFGDRNLPGVDMFLSDDAAGLDAGVEVEDGFDLLGKNLHSSDVNDRLAAPNERQQSIRTTDNEIATGEVSVVERVGIPWDEICIEQAWAADVELTGFAIGDEVSGGVKKSDFIGR